MALSQGELEAMSRRELQALAKEHGIKANAKTVLIIAALVEVFAAETETEPISELAEPTSEEMDLEEPSEESTPSECTPLEETNTVDEPTEAVVDAMDADLIVDESPVDVVPENVMEADTDDAGVDAPQEDEAQDNDADEMHEDSPQGESGESDTVENSDAGKNNSSQSADVVPLPEECTGTTSKIEMEEISEVENEDAAQEVDPASVDMVCDHPAPVPMEQPRSPVRQPERKQWINSPRVKTLQKQPTSSEDSAAYQKIMADLDSRCAAKGISGSVADTLTIKVKPVPRKPDSHIPIMSSATYKRFERCHNKNFAQDRQIAAKRKAEDAKRATDRAAAMKGSVHDRLYARSKSTTGGSTKATTAVPRFGGAGQVPGAKLSRTPKNTLHTRPAGKIGVKKPKFDLQASLSKGALPWQQRSAKPLKAKN